MRVAVVLLVGRVLLLLVTSGYLAAHPGAGRRGAATGTAAAVAMRDVRDLKLIFNHQLNTYEMWKLWRMLLFKVLEA